MELFHVIDCLSCPLIHIFVISCAYTLVYCLKSPFIYTLKTLINYKKQNSTWSIEDDDGLTCIHAHLALSTEAVEYTDCVSV